MPINELSVFFVKFLFSVFLTALALTVFIVPGGLNSSTGGICYFFSNFLIAILLLVRFFSWMIKKIDKWPRLVKTLTVLALMIPAYLYFALGPFWIAALAMGAVQSFQRGMILHSFGAGLALLLLAFASLHCPFAWFASPRPNTELDLGGS